MNAGRTNETSKNFNITFITCYVLTAPQKEYTKNVSKFLDG